MEIHTDICNNWKKRIQQVLRFKKICEFRDLWCNILTLWNKSVTFFNARLPMCEPFAHNISHTNTQICHHYKNFNISFLLVLGDIIWRWKVAGCPAGGAFSPAVSNRLSGTGLVWETGERRFRDAPRSRLAVDFSQQKLKGIWIKCIWVHHRVSCQFLINKTI